jgi:hypothetical protein
VKRLSRCLFTLEAVPLAYLTFLALLLIAGFVLPAVTGTWRPPYLADAMVGVTILLGLVCAWRLAISFIFFGNGAARQLSRWWWGIASAFALASVAIATHSWVMGPEMTSSSFGMIGYGALFVPSYIHLAAEVWLRAV